MMNRKNKFLFSLLCLVFMILVSFGLVGCKKTNDDITVIPQEQRLEFSINNKELVIYSTFQLHVNQTDGITFESSDENVVIVDNNGLVYANGFGEATITAKVRDLQAKCSITVIGQNIVPSIQVDQENISLVWSNNKQVGTSFDIYPKIQFNGATFTDGEYTYSSSNPNIVSVGTNGQISAKGFGDAVISIQGNWRDSFDASVLNKNINVSVMPDATIELIPESSVISTVNITVNGVAYSNQTSFTARVVVDGSDCDEPITYIIEQDDIDRTGTTMVEGDDNVIFWPVNIDENSIIMIKDNNIIANKVGQASIVAQCVVEGVEINSVPMVIEVVAPTIQADESIYNVKNNSTYGFQGIEGEFVSLSINGVNYNKYVDVDSLSLDLSKFYETVLGDNFIEISTTKYNYQYPVKFVTHIITNGQEFKNCISNKNSTIYAILANDISFSVGAFSPSSTSSFKGVFDGQGYTIDASGTKISSAYGLFGRLNGEIRNFALINATVFGKESTVLGERMYEGGAVKNVYIQAQYEENTQKDYTELDAKKTKYYCGLFVRGFRFENIIVNIQYPEDAQGYALCGDDSVIVVKNAYCFGDALQLAKTNASACYPNLSAMLLANLSSLTYKNGFSQFWYFNDSFIRFGNLQIGA